MHRAAAKRLLFLLSLFHSAASTFFLNGEPFYAQGLGKGLGWIALSQVLVGLFIALGAALGGQIAQHRGPRPAILLGLWSCLLGALAGWIGTRIGNSLALLIPLAMVSAGEAMVWPGIEAGLVAGESASEVQHSVGYFNIIWSAGTATAFLCATPIMHTLGLKALFILPAIFYIAGMTVTYRLPMPLEQLGRTEERAPSDPLAVEEAAAGLTTEQHTAFRQLGWLANPISYLAINTIVTYNPIIGARLGLGASASVWCGLWFYVRMATFELLRRWNGWHYRQWLLCTAFATMMASFALFILATNLVVLLLAQIVLGLSVGLLYQSSLFYSMAESETQGAHGGVHEACIGAGQMVGPLITYAGAQYAPHDGALPVRLVLVLMSAGLMALLWIARRAGRTK